MDDRASRWAAVAALALALATLAAGLAMGLPQLGAVAAALVGGAYALGLVVDEAPLDVRAPLYAVGLLLVCELAVWSVELRRSPPGEPGLLSRHAAWLGLLVLVVLTLGGGVIALADTMRAEGIVADAVGAAAVLAAAAMLWGAARGWRTIAGVSGGGEVGG